MDLMSGMLVFVFVTGVLLFLKKDDDDRND